MNTPGNFSLKMAQDVRRISHYIFWQGWTVDVSVTWSPGEAGTEHANIVHLIPTQVPEPEP